MAAEARGEGQAGARNGRIGRLAGCAALVGALGFGMVWGGRLIEAKQASAVAATGPRLQSASSEDAALDDPHVPSARTIGESNSRILPNHRSSGLERTAPRAPLGPSALAEIPEKATPPLAPPLPNPGTPRPTLLFGAVATAAGRIEAVGHVIELEGVKVVDPTSQCDGQSGAWPCGMVARAAFRAWLRGRAVECTVTPQPLPQPVLSLCRLGGRDMAAWLVTNGLAEASSGSAYEQAGQEARAAHRGIFGDRPRSLPMSSAPVATALDPGALEPDPPEAAETLPALGGPQAAVSGAQ